MPVNLDSSPAYCLIRANGEQPPINNLKIPKGGIVNISDHTQLIGRQVPPDFCEVVISDATVRQCLLYSSQWETKIGFELLNVDPQYDKVTARVFVQNEEVSYSGLNQLTKSQVEAYLGNWGGVVDDNNISFNSVQFDAYIYHALTSSGFWRHKLTGFTFTEKTNEYDPVTGSHTIEADFSGTSLNSNKVAGIVVSNGCEVTQVAAKKVTFIGTRGLVFEQFKFDVRIKMLKIFAVRKWYLLEGGINAALAAGGQITVTKTQALNYLHSRIAND